MSDKILVTGGAGYVGAHTALTLFEAGFQPILLDNFSRSDRRLLYGLEQLMGTAPVFYEGDCADAEFLKSVIETEWKVRGVIHFAAFKSVGESVEKPGIYYENNIGSLITLLKVCKNFGISNFIFSSSCTVYGEPDQIPVTEDAPFKRAESPYGATKQMCERILEDFSVADNTLKVISLRYFNPIGAHPSAQIGELPIGTPNNLVPYITQTAIGRRGKLVIFGGDYDTIDGTCVRDFIDIVDLANGHVAALMRMLGSQMRSNFEPFNLGTGVGVSVLKLVNTFVDVTGVDLPFEIGPRRQGDVGEIYGDTTKAESELGWKASVPLAITLRNAWNWEKRAQQIK
ncbi:MAG: UDP-glucose 4-epimerase GalE [Cyclobacteriaceae bacterium]